MPRIRAILGVVDQFAKKRWCQAIDVAARLTDDVARHKLRRVLEHVDEAVQLAQNIVRDVLGRARFSVQINRNIRIAKAQFTDEDTQIFNRTRDILWRINVEFFVINGEDKRARPTLLLGKGAQVTVARDPDDFHTLGLDRCRQSTNTQTRGVLRTVILIDDKNRKAKFHPEDSAENE